MSPAPKRRWLRFSLRTIFVVVTVAAIFFGLITRETIWLIKRRSVADRFNLDNNPFSRTEYGPAPGLLWVFGESGYSEMDLDGFDLSAGDIQEIRMLFPEAHLILSSWNSAPPEPAPH